MFSPVQLPDGPYDIRAPRAIPIETIAAQLAHVRRFPDHPAPYSLAEFSVLRSELAPPQARVHALLADADKAVSGAVLAGERDLLNRMIPGVVEARERAVRQAVFTGFDLNPDDFKTEVQRADLVALALAVRHVIGFDRPELAIMVRELRTVSMSGQCLSPRQAAAAFLLRFQELRGHETKEPNA